jgi:hypothetical protein
MILTKTSPPSRDVRARFADEQAEFKCFFKGLLVFVFGWPLIVSVILLISWDLLLVPSSNIFARSNVMRDAATGVALGYVIGFLPAVIIGTVISGLQLKRRSFGFIHVLLIALVVGVIFAGWESPKDGYPDAVMRWTNAVIKLTAVLVATLGCWAIACRWLTACKTSGA